MSELWAGLLEEFYAPLDERGRRILSPSPPEAVVSWPPPRGGRGADGGWKWSLASRPADSFVTQVERISVEGYRVMACRIVNARKERRSSLRQLSTTTGVALSVLTGLENGSAWPRFNTLATVADAVGLRVQVAGPRAQTPGQDRVDEQALEESWLAAGYPVAVSWQVLIVDELRHRMFRSGLSKTGLARGVRLRHNTVTELYHLDDFSYAGVRTLSALAAGLGTSLEVVPRKEPRS